MKNSIKCFQRGTQTLLRSCALSCPCTCRQFLFTQPVGKGTEKSVASQYPPLKGKSAHFSAHNFHLKYEFKVFLSLASPHKNNSAAICIFDVLKMNTKMTHVLFIRCLYLLVNTLLQTSYNLSIQKSCFCIKLLVSVILETMTRASISGLQSSSYTMILKSTSGFSSLITAIIVSL